MPSPTEEKRRDAAALLTAALATNNRHSRTNLPIDALLPIVDAIADYAIALAFDHLTATASAIIFRHAQRPPDPAESDTASEPG